MTSRYVTRTWLERDCDSHVTVTEHWNGLAVADHNMGEFVYWEARNKGNSPRNGHHAWRVRYIFGGYTTESHLTDTSDVPDTPVHSPTNYEMVWRTRRAEIKQIAKLKKYCSKVSAAAIENLWGSCCDCICIIRKLP